MSLEQINRLLASGAYQPALSVIKGFRNGAVYGAKIRFPHALVMTLLFKRGSLKEMAKGIAEATYTHSRNLAMFVFAYKSLTNMLSWIQSDKQQYQSFVAAFCAGYFIFGKYNKVNEQLAVKRGYISKPKQDTFPWFAAIVWGIVLWMFEYEKDTLQPSLKSSMTYLYHDSNSWVFLQVLPVVKCGGVDRLDNK
ncbi:hypothetical protein KUTeg_022953 [Tegillarca granosa]|uniref:Peroxisomal membrane protein 4 n=1 Tax=Tegillarca granosa TaxID=220873 RepID=A0ABQ9E0A3_TEGGR|nr:hypothetical protein KUTeg_022953 [Tegillarca granosa]